MTNTSTTLPDALQTIVQRLGFRHESLEEVGGFKTYEVDLTEWGLNLSDRNPCIWVQGARADALAAPTLADSLKDVVRERNWQNRTVLIFVDGSVGSLRTHLPTAMPAFIVIDRDGQQAIKEAPSPTVAALEIMLGQLPRSQLAPYETNKPVTGAQFYGRQYEINKVMQHPGSSYLFLGIRRVGKTSLLKELKRRMDDQDPPGPQQTRRLYVDCTVFSSEEDFLRTLTYHLDRSEMRMLMGRAAESMRYKRMMFDRFASLHGEPITILVDELDRLLKRIGDQAPLWDVLRAAASEGKARFIMAGFRQAMQASTNMQSPFFNMVEPVNLGEFRRSDVQSLVLIPMERLRITIKNPDGVVSRIIRETAGLPNYVQYYCKILLEQLDEQERDTITEDDLRSVYENREFRNFILDTFMSNTEPLERGLIYGLVAATQGPPRHAGFSQKEMYEILAERNLKLNIEELERTCRNLEVAGVLNQVGRDFEFAVPLLQRMLKQTRDVNFLFRRTRDEILATRSNVG